jgi:GntR family transcriptional regulator/MocR family aminotransferase
MQLVFSLESGSKLPLYKQMANAICRAVDEGLLRQGQVMPSSRQLAENMTVSRLTARRCYEELIGQGYIRTQHRGKTVVCKTMATPSKAEPKVSLVKDVELSEFGRVNILLKDELCDTESLVSFFALTPQSQLPKSRWQECLYEAVREQTCAKRLVGQDPFGSLALRSQLQALLARTRGIRCGTEQIIVIPTTEGGLDLMCRITLNKGDLVATEDPGFLGIRRSFRMNGAQVRPIPLDTEGIKIDELARLEQPPRLVYVTPSSQDTIGVVMSKARRDSLLRWVSSIDGFIIEDDFDSEFRHGQAPQPSIFSQDCSGRVIYKYNFWKPLYPLLKMSFMVIPASLIPACRNALGALYPDTPQLEQLALATFIGKGHYERHLQRCRKDFAVKRASLIYALTKIFAEKVSINKQSGGTNLTARFDSSLLQAAIECAAERSGLSILSTKANYALIEPPKNEYLISFSDINESEIEAQVAEFNRQLYSAKDQHSCDIHAHEYYLCTTGCREYR